MSFELLVMMSVSIVVVLWDLTPWSAADVLNGLEKLDVLVMSLLGKECQRVRNII